MSGPVAPVAPPAPGTPELPEFLQRPGAAASPSGVVPRPRRTRIWLPVTVAVVVIVAAAAIFASGAIKFPGVTNSGSGIGDLPVSGSALNAANGAASSVAGGPWTPIFVAGVASSVSVLLPESTIVDGLDTSGCQVDWQGGGPHSVWLPSTPASAPAGSSAAWLVGFASNLGSVSSSVLLVSVTNASAQPLLVLSGGSCVLAGLVFDSLTGYTDLANSTAAVTAANEVGGASFLANHSVSSRVFALTALLDERPTWNVAYSTCEIGLNGTTGASFNATVDAISGTSTHGTVSDSCTGNLTLGLSGASGAHDAGPGTPAISALPALARLLG